MGSGGKVIGGALGTALATAVLVGGAAYWAHSEDTHNSRVLSHFENQERTYFTQHHVDAGATPGEAEIHANELVFGTINPNRDELVRAMRWNGQGVIDWSRGSSNPVTDELSTRLRHYNMLNTTTQTIRDERGVWIDDAHGAHQVDNFCPHVPLSQVRDVQRPDVAPIIERYSRVTIGSQIAGALRQPFNQSGVQRSAYERNNG